MASRLTLPSATQVIDSVFASMVREFQWGGQGGYPVYWQRPPRRAPATPHTESKDRGAGGRAGEGGCALRAENSAKSWPSKNFAFTKASRVLRDDSGSGHGVCGSSTMRTLQLPGSERRTALSPQ